MFRFASPYFLILLLIIPGIVIFRLRKPGKGCSPEIKVSSLSFLENCPKSLSVKLSPFLMFLKYLALIFMIVALARPQWGTKKINVTTKGINIVLALDLSGSMAALDFKLKGKVVTRLDAVKSVVRQFIMKRKSDRIGMVVFGSEAFTQVPLTRDYNAILFILDRLKIGAAGPNTAIGDAIGISIKRLSDIKSKSNIIILLTDGKSNSGELSPEAAAEIAAKKGIKIYTIGVGSRGRAPFLVNDPVFGQRYVYQNVDIDYTILKKIAEETNASFFAAKDTKTLENIYSMIDRLEKTKVKVKAWAQYNDLYPWFLIPGFILLFLFIVFSNTVFLRVP